MVTKIILSRTEAQELVQGLTELLAIQDLENINLVQKDGEMIVCKDTNSNSIPEGTKEVGE